MTSYQEVLKRDVRAVSDGLRAGNMPMKRRIKMLKRASDRYVLAQAERYHADKAAGKNPPIPFRDSDTLHIAAELVMDGFIKWSHPDKMSIVEYPFMTDTQQEERERKYKPNSDLQFGDRRFAGRRKTHFTDDIGAPQVRNHKMADPYDPGIEAVTDNVDLYNALENAGLTQRQREAIDLVFFGGMTQEVAAAELGLRQNTISEYISVGLAKLNEYMTKDYDTLGV